MRGGAGRDCVVVQRYFTDAAGAAGDSEAAALSS